MTAQNVRKFKKIQVTSFTFANQTLNFANIHLLAKNRYSVAKNSTQAPENKNFSKR